MSYNSSASCLLSSLLCFMLQIWLPVHGQYNFESLEASLSSGRNPLGKDLIIQVHKDDSLIFKKESSPEFTSKMTTTVESAGQGIAVATIMTFVDQGKLDLDDPVSKYLPVFTKYAKSYLTIRHCLSHTTGIESEVGKMAKVFGGRRKFATLEDEVNAIAAKEISNNPEKEFHYGNLGINIAARVVEVIGKKSFDRLAQERIIRPLKMRATSFTDENGGAVNPSRVVRSSANDLMNFLVMMLNNGKFAGKQILSAEAVAQMESKQFTGLPVKYLPAEATGFEFGLGTWISEKKGPDEPGIYIYPGSAGHWGIVDKCRKYAAVVFANKAAETANQQSFLSVKESIDEQLRSNCN